MVESFATVSRRWWSRLDAALDRALDLVAGPNDRGKGQALRVGVFTTVVAFVGAVPQVGLLRSRGQTTLWKAANLFEHTTGSARSHGAKLDFRLTMPALGNTLNLDQVGYYVIEVAVGVIAFSLMFRLLERLTGNCRYATVSCIGLACTYVGQAYVNDIDLYFDGVALALVLGALSVRFAPAAAVLCALALFTDERALFALVLGVLAARALPRFEISFGGLVAGAVVYLLGRLGLTALTELRTETGGVRFLAAPGWLGPRGYLFAWTGMWLVILPAMWRSVREEKFAPVVAGFVATSLISLAVYDVSRSMIYALPAVLGAFVMFFRVAPGRAVATMRLAATAALVFELLVVVAVHTSVRSILGI